MLKDEDTAIEPLQAAVAELEKLRMEVGQQIYQAQATPSPDGDADEPAEAETADVGASDQPVDDDDVVDAEFSASDER